MALTIDSQSVDASLAISPIVPVEKLTTQVSLVVPARNEARNIATVLTGIPDCVDEVILVDGNSTDATVAMATLCRPDIRVIGQDVPGKGAALRAGFLAATGDVIVMIDADGEHVCRGDPPFSLVSGATDSIWSRDLDLSRVADRAISRPCVGLATGRCSRQSMSFTAPN